MLNYRNLVPFFAKNKELALLAGAFVAIHLLLYAQLGIVTSGEAEKYIEQGERLYLYGHFSESKYFFYLPVILLVSLCKVLHLSVSWIVLVQLILSAISQYCFYRLVNNFTGNKRIAFFTSLILLLFVPYQAWNLYLYSESIFLSLTIFFAFAVYRAQQLRWFSQFVPLCLLCLLILSRPTGILLTFPWALFLVLRRQSLLSRLAYLAIATCLVLVALSLVNVLYTGGADFNSLLPYVQAHIICGVPTIIADSSLPMAADRGAIGNLLHYILQHPLQFIQLFFQRLYSFFNLTRSYYSSIHNTLLLIFLLPVYLFSIRGWITLIQQRNPYTLFLIILFIVYPCLIALQCDDWHSRFTMLLIPHLVMLAVIGVGQWNATGKKQVTP